MVRFRIFLILAFICSPAVVFAQLADTEWGEFVTLQANSANAAETGQDALAPEEITQNASDGLAGCSGSVSFGPPGPPQGTVTIGGFSEVGAATINGASGLTIVFQARVMQTSAPPVAITTVPVSISASGSVDASGSPSFQVESAATITIFEGFTLLFDAGIAANNIDDEIPGSDSFNESATADLPVGAVMTGTMNAVADITGASDAGGGTASAFIDPVVEVMDQTIPGSSDSYRDHFEMAFSPGYYALGSTPAEPTTWGKIKGLYRN